MNKLSYILLESSGGPGVIIGGVIAGLIIYFALKAIESSKKKISENKFTKTVQTATNKLRENPNDEDAIVLVGIGSYSNDDIVTAKNNFEKALLINQNSIGAKIYLTLIHYNLQELQTCEKYATEVIDSLEKSNNISKAVLATHNKFGQGFPLCLYCYGHVLNIKGEKERANELKLAALNLDESLKNLNYF